VGVVLEAEHTCVTQRGILGVGGESPADHGRLASEVACHADFIKSTAYEAWI
jgi:hypothetical protein